MKSLKASIDLSCTMEPKQVLVARQQSTPYQKQKSALEIEFKNFFLESTLQRDMCTAVPDDVVDLLTGRRYGDRLFIKWAQFCRDSQLA